MPAFRVLDLSSGLRLKGGPLWTPGEVLGGLSL